MQLGSEKQALLLPKEEEFIMARLYINVCVFVTLDIHIYVVFTYIYNTDNVHFLRWTKEGVLFLRLIKGRNKSIRSFIKFKMNELLRWCVIS